MFRSIKSKILLSHLSAIIIVVVVTGGVSYSLLKKYVITEQRSKLEVIATSAAAHIDDFFNDKLALMDRLSQGREVEEFSTTYRDLALIQYLSKFRNEFSLLSYVNENGMEEAKVVAGGRADNTRDLSGNTAVQIAIRTQKVAINPVEYPPELQGAFIGIYLPKHEYFGNKLNGVIRGLIPVEKITRYASTIKVGKSGFVSIIDKDGVILTLPDNNKLLKDGTGATAINDFIDKLTTLKEGSGRAGILGVDGIHAYSPVKSLGWTVLVTVPLREFMENPNALAKYMLPIFLAVCAFVSAGAYLLAFKITVPITTLVDMANRVADGNFGQTLEVQTMDEVGKLITSFNDMSLSLNEKTISLNTMHDSLIIASREGIMKRVNESACNLLGYGKEELIGRPLEHLFPQGHVGSFTNNILGRVFTEGVMRNIQTVVLTREGREIPVLFSISLMKGGNSEIEGIICMAVDITERVEAERKLAETQKQLVESAHKAGMADIATGILHNFGNVLNSVNTSVEKIGAVTKTSKVTSLMNANELLRAHSDDMVQFLTTDVRGRKLPQFYEKLGVVLQEEYESIQADVTRIEEKIATMRGIVETQQEYARAEFLAEREDISKIIDDVLMIQRDLLDSSGVRVTKAYSGTQRCKVYKNKLVQVLLNLTKNAVEAMRGNDFHNKTKDLIIETGQFGEGTDYIRVIDNGSGIPQENLIRIFNHGFTTKEKGNGFGLHACANAVAEMGGSITVESEGENRGASFTVKLPVGGCVGVAERNT